MKSQFAITKSVAIAATVIALSAPASADGSASHDLQLARVATYQPADGFSHVVAGKRFTGFFLSRRGTCSVSLIVSDADDEALRTPPQRMQFELGATQGVDVSASPREALGVACGVDADALSVARLSRTGTRTVQCD